MRKETGMQAAVLDLIEQGVSQVEIARRFKVDKSAISHRLRCYRNRNGIPHPRPLRRRRRVIRPLQLSAIESF